MTEPVRWGFLGAGGIAGSALAPAVHTADGAVLHAAAARDPARAAVLEPARVHPAYDDLLADPDVDAVYISLANDAHRPWALRALAAGKHVLCEKPLALTAGEVDEMTAAAAAADRLLVEASWYRWHPRVRLAQRLLADGAVAPVRHVAGGFTFPGPPPGNYRFDPHLGGGALYDVGCYPLSAVLWAFAPARPLEVAARLEIGPTGVDLGADVLVTYADGDAEVRAGMAEPERQWLVITGERGELELRPTPYTAWRDRDTELLRSDGTSTERTPVPAADPYRLMVEAVSARIRGEDAYVVPLAESRATAAVLDAAFASGRRGGEPVPVK